MWPNYEVCTMSMLCSDFILKTCLCARSRKSSWWLIKSVPSVMLRSANCFGEMLLPLIPIYIICNCRMRARDCRWFSFTLVTYSYANLTKVGRHFVACKSRKEIYNLRIACFVMVLFMGLDLSNWTNAVCFSSFPFVSQFLFLVRFSNSY